MSAEKQPLKYLSIKEFAQRIGVTANTIHGYSAKGMLPTPDAVIGCGKSIARGWLPETIDAWNASRPGPGNWRKNTTG